MDYEKKYKEALKLARDYRNDKNCFKYLKGVLENIFPELKEAKDERIRKGLITIYRDIPLYSMVIDDVRAEDIIKWLEKQGNKPQGKTALEAIHEEKIDNTNKVEPKFKLEHDKWYRCILTPVVHKHFTVGKVYKCELEGCLVDDINEDRIVDLDLECFRPATEDEIPQEKSEVKVAIADLETPQDPILIRLDRIYDLLLEIRNNNMLRLPYITTTPYIPQPQQPWYDIGKVYCDKAQMETTTNTIEDERPETTM